MEHNNELYFHVNGISKMSYSEITHYIESGKKYKSTTMSNIKDEVSKVVIVAERNASKNVAKDYNQNTGLAHSVASKVALDLQPESLNFAVKGYLKVTPSKNDKEYQSEVLFAQGHNTHNNWWVGSKSIYGYPGSFFGTSRGIAILSVSEDDVKKRIQELFDYVYNGICTLINNTEEFLEKALELVRNFVASVETKLSSWIENNKNRKVIDNVLNAIIAFLSSIVTDINTTINSLEDFAKKIEEIVNKALDNFIKNDSTISEYVIKLFGLLDLFFISIVEKGTNDFILNEWKLF